MINNRQRQKKRTGPYFGRGDAELLRCVAEFHYLQVPHFEKLTGRLAHSLRRRLIQLYRSQLLDRFTLPLEREWTLPNPPGGGFVYGLSRRGLERAKTLGFADEQWQYNDEKKTTHLGHDLALTSFHLGLELAARAECWQLLSWEQRRRELLDWAPGPNGARLPVNPDALFSLVDPRLPQGENTRVYFLEIERSRQHSYNEAGESAFIQKCQAYERYARHDRHRDSWGISDFRVAVVVATPERAKNLLAKLERSGLGLKRFWLTDAASFSLEDPTTIAGNIFRTPRDHATGALYSFSG